jgi:hypothetical protein
MQCLIFDFELFSSDGLAPLQTVLSFFPKHFFWQKRNTHEKWRKPYERAKQEISNGIWFG